MYLRERSHRTGSITFAEPESVWSWLSRRGTSLTTVHRLDMIENPRRVYHILREARAARLANAASSRAS